MDFSTSLDDGIPLDRCFVDSKIDTVPVEFRESLKFKCDPYTIWRFWTTVKDLSEDVIKYRLCRSNSAVKIQQEPARSWTIDGSWHVTLLVYSAYYNYTTLD